ncbi:hypothetical protein HVZ46_05070 [Citrobacter freundii]|nr:toxin C-terminal domain-containing protein [Citrobacter freundii]QMD23938.1 hypothetical protein HVZ46_05070 [Citrobacter freundii]
MSRWKGVSGKNVAASDIQQGKPVVSHGKGRRKSGPSQQLTSERVVAENNALSLIARGCAVAAPCRTKVAEQLLEIGAKAGMAGLAGAAIKEMADKMTPDELDHLVTLEMMGNDDITAKYLGSLQDKYAPSHTGNNNGQVDVGPRHTGNNSGQADAVPNHTGNNQASGQGAANTGNTEDAPNTGGNTTVTPLPDGPGKDELAYLALKGKEAQEAAGKLGFDRRIPAQKAPFNSHGQSVFYDGKNYITPDVDSHNVTNGWKMFDRKGNRIGTYDNDLNRIKD